MRKKQDAQVWLDFQGSSLKVTNEFFKRYARIEAVLNETPKPLTLVHHDLKAALEDE